MVDTTFATEAAQANAKRLVELLARGMVDADEAVIDYDYERRVEEIEHEPRDGFWPWTSGGYMVTLPASLAHHWGSGNAPAPLQPMLEAGGRFIAEAWNEQHPDGPTFEDAIRDGDPEAVAWEEEGWQADGDTYFWKARAIFYQPGDPSADADMDEPYVHVDAYLNTDLNYGRDSVCWLRAYGGNPDQTVGDFQRRIPLREFVTMTDAQLREIADAAVNSLP